LRLAGAYFLKVEWKQSRAKMDVGVKNKLISKQLQNKKPQGFSWSKGSENVKNMKK